jgi:hypothetical protein
MKSNTDYERVEETPVVVEEPKKAGRPKADAVKKTEAEAE